MTKDALEWTLNLLRGTDFVDVVGADGKTYAALAKNSRSGTTSTSPWAVSFISTTSISLVVPPCYFQQGTGSPQPTIMIGGNPVNYTVPSNNILTVPVGLSYLLLDVLVDDSNVNGIITTSVTIIAKNQADYDALANTLTHRYVPLIVINTSTRETSLPWQSYGIKTIRLGDRNDSASMFWYKL